jgi:hypothetical protein
MITREDIIFEDFSIKINPELEEINEETFANFSKDMFKLGKDIISKKSSDHKPIEDKFTDQELKILEPQIKKIYNYSLNIINKYLKNGDYNKYIVLRQYNINEYKETFKAVGDIIIYEGDANKYYNLYKNTKRYNKQDASTIMIKDFENFGKTVKNKLKLPEGVTFKEFASWTDADEYIATLHFDKTFAND